MLAKAAMSQARATCVGNKWLQTGAEEPGRLQENRGSAGQTPQGDSQRHPEYPFQVAGAEPRSPLGPPGCHGVCPTCPIYPPLHRSCTYRLKPGSVWGWRLRRSAGSASQRGAREPSGSSPGRQRRRWQPHLWCSSSSTYGRENSLRLERTQPRASPSYPLLEGHDSIVYLFERGASGRSEARWWERSPQD